MWKHRHDWRWVLDTHSCLYLCVCIFSNDVWYLPMKIEIYKWDDTTSQSLLQYIMEPPTSISFYLYIMIMQELFSKVRPLCSRTVDYCLKVWSCCHQGRLYGFQAWVPIEGIRRGAGSVPISTESCLRFFVFSIGPRVSFLSLLETCHTSSGLKQHTSLSYHFGSQKSKTGVSGLKSRLSTGQCFWRLQGRIYFLTLPAFRSWPHSLIYGPFQSWQQQLKSSLHHINWPWHSTSPFYIWRTLGFHLAHQGNPGWSPCLKVVLITTLSPCVTSVLPCCVTSHIRFPGIRAWKFWGGHDFV